MTTRITLLLALCANSYAADLFPVAGAVISSVTGAPLNHALVIVLQSGTVKEVTSLITGDDGRFVFNLPQGSYSLRGGDRDTQSSYGAQTAAASLGSAVIVGPNKDTGNLVIRWYPPGAITGRILDEAGEPAERTLVHLIRSAVIGGRRVTSTFSWFWTDDRGIYRFGRLPPGTYYVAAAGEPWYSRNSAMRFGSQQHEAPSAFLPVYYPGTAEVSQATPVVVKAGEDFHADFSLRTVPGTNVNVTFQGTPGAAGTVGLTRPALGGSVQYIVRESLYEYSSRISFPAIPPGHYTLRAFVTGASGSQYLVQPIDVAGVTLELPVALHPVPNVSGKLDFANSSQKAKGAIVVWLLSEEESGNCYAAAKPDGTFTIPGARPGRYRVVLRGTDGFFASSVQADGTELKDGILDITSGEPVNLTIAASGESARLKGFVMNNDKPVPGVLAVLIPVNAAAAKSWQYRAFQTESDGSFDFLHVPAGDYYFFAIRDTTVEYENPLAVKPWLPKAEKIHLGAYAEVSENAVLLVN